MATTSARAAARAERVAAVPPRYQRDLAQGTGRFFVPRREDCPWCGSRRLARRLRTTDVMQGRPGRFTLERCRDCGHIFQNPRLSPAGLDFYYRDFYDGLGEETATELLGRRSTGRFLASVRAVAPFSPRPGLWLDVGAARGYFCATAAHALPETEFHGLDMGENVELALTERRIARAFRGTFTDLAGELAGRYDVVSMFHYLEHTLEPKRELAAAHTVLRPGGLLVIEVPNPECPFARLLGRRWSQWLQPQHLHLAPVSNVAAELERRGFTVLAADRWSSHIPIDLVAALWYAYSRLLPAEDAPWRATAPGPAARAARKYLSLAALPPVLAAYGLDLLLAPLARRMPLANAYRVVARRG